MPETELLDIVDETGKITGKATRAEFHSNPKLIHAVVHCWIYNGKGEILWQQRSLKKKHGPGMWDVSAGGHVPSGMTPTDAMKKEISEELGLTDIEPVFADKYLKKFAQQNELVYLYYAYCDKPVAEFKLNKDEVERVIWVRPEEAMRRHKRGEVESTDWMYEQLPMLEKVMKELKP